jgi:sugar lactone lactonase YvrE
MRSDLEIACPAEDVVGESPFWAEEEAALYWVDILRKVVQRLEPGSGQHDRWKVPDFPTAIALRQRGGAVLV